MNGLDAFNTNRRASYDDQQGLQDLVTRRQAGASLAKGDYTGAASTLYGAGDLSGGAGVQKMEQNQQDRADERVGMEQKAEKDRRLEELGFLKDSASILARIPADQRQKAFNEAIAPALKMQGMPDELIAQIQQSPLDDVTLQAFGSQLDEAIKGVVMAPGSQLRDPRTGDLLAEAPFAPKLEKIGEGDTLVEIPGSNPSGAPKGGPRNMRNNNPGNIEDGPFAQSLPGYAGSDGRFAIFTDPKAGSSAQVALLGSYGRRGIKTVQDAINRWAPASDNNDPVAYAKFVAQRLGVSPNQEIDLTDPVIASDMASAIQQFEGGPESKSNGSQPGARVLAQGGAKPQTRPATDAEKAVYGIPPSTPAQISPDGKIDVIALPKGTADIERDAQSKQAQVLKAKDIIELARAAKADVGQFSAGTLGGNLSGIKGTPAYNLERSIDTIKANLGFQELAAMRAASPTGGALGAIAVQELNALQSTVASLDTGQSPAQLRANLDKIERHYQRWVDAVEGKSTAAPTPKATTQTRAPPPVAVQYLRANPQLKAQFDAKYGQGAAAKVLGK